MAQISGKFGAFGTEGSPVLPLIHWFLDNSSHPSFSSGASMVFPSEITDLLSRVWGDYTHPACLIGIAYPLMSDCHLSVAFGKCDLRYRIGLSFDGKYHQWDHLLFSFSGEAKEIKGASPPPHDCLKGKQAKLATPSYCRLYWTWDTLCQGSRNDLWYTQGRVFMCLVARNVKSLPQFQEFIVHLVSFVQLFVTPWTTAHQPSLSYTVSWSLLKLMFIKWVMLSNHLILCHPLLLLPSIFSRFRVFSNESALHIRWSKYWSFDFSISPFNEYSGLRSFRIDWSGFKNTPWLRFWWEEVSISTIRTEVITEEEESQMACSPESGTDNFW